jgi:chromosome segregation ATPase
VTEHTAAMERMRMLEDNLARERGEAEAAADLLHAEKTALAAKVEELTAGLQAAEYELEAAKSKAGALVKELQEVRTLMKDLVGRCRLTLSNSR